MAKCSAPRLATETGTWQNRRLIWKEKRAEGYEWTAHVININYGQNAVMMEKCRTLSDYSAFVDMIRENRKGGMDMEAAVTKAVDDCISQDILKDYLVKNRERAISSLISEYDEAATMRYIRDEGHDEGWDEKSLKDFENCLKKGLSVEMAQEITEITDEQAKSVIARMK